MSNATKIFTTLFSIAAFAACTSSTQAPANAPSAGDTTTQVASPSGAPGGQANGNRMAGGGMMGGGMMGPESCPMTVPGTSVEASDVEGGASLAFHTTGDVAQLRQRVHSMADLHNQRMQGGMMGPGMKGQGMGGGRMGGGMMGGGMMPASTASVEDIDAGAKLVFKPKDPAQLSQLREHLSARSEHMKSGTCPMMDTGPKTAAAPAEN